MKEEKGLYIEL